MNQECKCGNDISSGRVKLGYRTCLQCGDKVAIKARESWCVVPISKSNYTLVTDPTLLKCLNTR